MIKRFDQFDRDASALRKALVAVALPVALFLAVVVQLTVVNRLPLPGGDAPDLVLLLVAAVAVTSNTMIATLTGFAGGLALDVAPPVSHYAGEYALVFCLVGYLAARVMAAISAASGGAERDPSIALAVMAVAAAAGEAGKAGLGMLLSDPNVTGPTIKHVLPGAILYDLLLTPVVYWLVSLVARLARPVSERAPAPVFFGPQRLASVFRLASAGAAPNLRLAGPGRSSPIPARRAGSRSCGSQTHDQIPSPERTVPPLTAPGLPLAGGRAAKLNFAHSRSALGGTEAAAPASAGARSSTSRTPAAPSENGARALGRSPEINFAGACRAHAPARRGPSRAALGRRTAARPAPDPEAATSPATAGRTARSRPAARRKGASARAGCARRPAQAADGQEGQARQGLAPPGPAAPRELVLKRPHDRLDPPLPHQGPVADPAPVAVRLAAVHRP